MKKNAIFNYLHSFFNVAYWTGKCPIRGNVADGVMSYGEMVTEKRLTGKWQTAKCTMLKLTWSQYKHNSGSKYCFSGT